MKYHIFILAFILGLSPALAEPTIKKNVQYYDVKGWDSAFIHNEMDAKGPRDRNSGDRVWAHTHWNVKWNFNYAEESLSCKISQVSTTVTINFIVPRWVERDKAPQLVKDKWDKFYAALQKHEQQHALHGVLAAREIESQLLNLPKKRTCNQAKDAGTQTARTIIKEHAKMDIEYDRKTDQGRTEGLVF